MLPTHPPTVTIQDLAKSYGKPPRPALEPLSLTFIADTCTAVVGASGCGKSTLLRLIAGIDTASAGSISFNDRPSQVGLAAYLTQASSLLPWYSIVDNIALPLRFQGISKSDSRTEARRVLHDLGLQDCAEAWPATLSGGMTQRVMLARTLLSHQAVLLLDEPFAALDALTRLDLHEWFLQRIASRPATTVLVTHDLDEAIHLAQRVIVLSPRPGRVVADVPNEYAQRDPMTVESAAGYNDLRVHLLQLLRQSRPLL